MAELELTPSISSSSYSFIEPEAHPPVDIPWPIPDTNTPLPSTPPCQETLQSNLKGSETKTVDFTTMVKMFLVRNRINVSTRADIDGLTNHVPSLMKEADAEYRELLQQAIDFCNLDIGASHGGQRTGGVMQRCEKEHESFVNLDFAFLLEILLTFSQL
jgi:hypothetical protein